MVPNRSVNSEVEGDGSTWQDVLRRALNTGELPQEWPDKQLAQEESDLRALAVDLVALRRFARALSAGDLSAPLQVKGQLAGSLKALQANLRHLTWQVQQIAAGDLDQRVDFMGDFSAAFNAMTEGLSLARKELSASERRYRLLAENVRDVIWTMDLQGRFTYVSPSVEFLRGYTPAEVMRQSIDQALTPASAQMAAAALQDALDRIAAGEREFPAAIYELEQPCKNGATVWTEATLTFISTEDGIPNAILGVSRDITERRRAEAAEREERLLSEALRDSAAALNSALDLDQVLDVILDNIHKVVPFDAVDVMLLEPDGKVHFIRSGGAYDIAAVALVQREPAESFPNLRQMVWTCAPVLVSDTRSADWRLVPGFEWIRSNLAMPLLIDGVVAAAFSLHSSRPGFFGPEQVERLTIFANQAAVAIQKAKMFERLNYLAIMDELTAVPNRRHFMKEAQFEVERSRRYNRPLSALMLDIDFFKKVNDTCGHAAGDQVLRGVASVCAATIRKVDLLGRYGGEEFVFLLPESGVKAAVQAAERLRSAIEHSSYAISSASVSVTVCIGVAEFLHGDDHLDRLLDRADKAMYQAKAAGRNQVIVFTPDYS